METSTTEAIQSLRWSSQRLRLSKERISTIDYQRLARDVLVSTVLFYAKVFVDFGAPPFEDAAILMRYAQHLAQGHGIVWNIGEAPVDGATDFLFMTSAAALIKLGLPIGRSVRVLSLGAHILTVLLVYWANRRIWGGGITVSLAAALYLAVGTGLWYVAAFFGTPFFAFFAVLTWSLALLLMRQDRPSAWLRSLFSVSAVVTGLVRPEGVLLGSLMLLAVVVVRGAGRSWGIVLSFVATMLVLGGSYFAWHWSYFGHPLPNPYYKKGGGLLHWDSFWESLGYLVRFAGPFVLAFVLGLGSRLTRRMSIAFAIPPVLFAAAFILVSNETNFGGRFQYALWPIVLISFFPLVSDLQLPVRSLWETSATSRIGWLMVGLLLGYALLRYGAAQSCRLTSAQQTCAIAYEADGRYELAKALAEYDDKDYVMATTEAGLLPLYSHWRAVDAWGLNDAWIARNGEITAEYLDRYVPNLITFHAYYSPLVPPRLNEKNLAQDWFRMTVTLKTYAEDHGYILAAAFGDSPYETHYYYVRSDFPDSERIIQDISTMRNYYWYATGRKAINYAGVGP